MADKKPTTLKGLFGIIISSAAELIEVTVQAPLPYIRSISKLGDAFEQEVNTMIETKEAV